MAMPEVARGRQAAALAVALAIAVLLGAMLAAPRAGAAPSSLRLGFTDGAIAGLPDRDAWFARARAEGAGPLRIGVTWSAVSPVAPPTDRAADPSWPGYRWNAVDDQIRAIAAGGLTPIVNVTGAPTWAQEPGRPAAVAAQAWKPDAAAYGRFMQALATRYSGSHPDPLAPGRALPRVAEFQLWNEPNLDLYLAPQWQDGKPFAPGRFRALVNAGSAGIKAAQPTARVIAGGLAPYGDFEVGGHRIAPVRFLRSMLCLSARLRRSCRSTTTVDAIAHHPYAIGSPSRRAGNADDATIPDLGKLTRVLRAARRAGTVGPRTPALWVTEVSYDSAPPDPQGVPTARLTRWTAELLWRLWAQGASTVLWYQVRDQEPRPSFSSTYQSGLYLRDGRRKPSAQAFRFPLVVTGRSSGRLTVWVRPPGDGPLRIEVRRAGRWRTATTLAGRAGRPRTVRVRRSGVRAVRAVVGSEASPAWRVG